MISDTALQDLFKLGARKFGIIGVPAIGCCPVQRKLSETGGCLEAMNAYSHLFFTSLQVLLKELSSECKGMLYSLGDTYTMTNAIMEKPLPLGNRVTGHVKQKKYFHYFGNLLLAYLKINCNFCRVGGGGKSLLW